MNIYKTSVVTLVLMATGCTGLLSATRPSDLAADEVQLGSTVKLRVGESVDVSGEGVKIQFDEVSNESRCPRGVTCVWEGDAVVKMRAMKEGQTSGIELHTSKRFAREASVGKSVVRLLDLSPVPKANQPIDSHDYVASVVVSKQS